MSFIKSTYNRLVRPRMPREMGTMAGVPIPATDVDHASFRVTDFTRHRPTYKQGLIDAIHEHVDNGDDVGLVGLGRGVSTTHTVRAGGQVTAYEATGEMIDAAETTLEWQGIRDEVEIVHGIVSKPGGEVYGEDWGDTIPVSELGHDTLVLDCEGAEAGIISNDHGADTLIVESHPRQGVYARNLVDILEPEFAVSTREYEPREDNPEKQVLVAQR